MDWTAASLTLLGWALATAAATWLAHHLDRTQHPLRTTVRMARGLLLPPVALYLALWLALQRSPESTGMKALETVSWLAGILVALSIVTNTAFVRRDGAVFASRYPKLLIDMLRLLLVLVGGCFVISAIWDQDLSGLLTALGISSIVLGLALQNTLDNVMAGIAVLFERPFEVGDWITVGELTGEVMEMNWRSVRIRTRDRDLFVVPNSVIGKETLVNLSRPTRAHAETHLLGFSYDDPPNKVKRVLHQVALSTRGVLANPPPEVHTRRYGDWSVEYAVRYYLDDYERQLEINDEFMTRIWYAAKRHGISIPFPTQIEYGMEPPPPPPRGRMHAEALTRIPVFVPLAPEELELLAADCERLAFARGERVVHQGDAGDTMFVILEGTAVVTLADERQAEREVARLSRGEFFGEMALLTGEPRTASVSAAEDLAVLAIHKDGLQTMLLRRPGLAQEMAEIVAARRAGLRAAKDLQQAPPEQRQLVQRAAGELVQRIRRFFGI